MSTFFGIEIGRRALMAQQRALETTSHNVANANTKGYSRQEAVLATTSPFSYPGMGAGQMGTGVAVQRLRRIRESFLDAQFRNETKALGRWEVRRDTLEKLEAILNEPGENGLSKIMDRFFAAWQELAKNPEGEAARSVVRQEGIALAEAFNHLAAQLNDLSADLTTSVGVRVNEVNSLARQIRDLNAQIVKAESGNMAANDLRDRRDLLLDELAKVVPIQVEEDKYGAVTIVVRDHTLLSGQQVNELNFNPSTGAVTWADGAPYVTGSNLYGSLEGLLEARDGLLREYRSRLDELVQNIAEAVNRQHRAGAGLDGSTGLDFFSFDQQRPSVTIKVNDAILSDTKKIAAAAPAIDPVTGNPVPPPPGDGSNALLIAQLKNGWDSNGDGKIDVVFSDQYNSWVADLGVRGQEAARMVDNQELLTSQLDSRRQAVSGVSLDEELTNMVRFQQAYNAAARLITAVDEMLDALINRTGLVGR
ncbi:MAG: flagellar hook-associated protein 1 [Bacillota bacterium]|nr:flagellar hook-associated protein 1 [Bacillota bacterium]MDK2855989.1 flagellar hook-associated protein 1 [Bacillota bacterium]MDK2925992.1 flagellar hook-associated protein 1 [Bacillota bacterium]